MRPLILILSFFLFTTLRADEPDLLRMVFWNVENLFDPVDDPLVADEEFTPGSVRNWTWYRYNAKITAIWKTLVSMQEEGLPTVIALCEIENEKVLNDLFLYSPLKYYSYKMVHFDSPDRRGIDLALFYDPSKINLLESTAIQPDLKKLGGNTTRDILMCRFIWDRDSLVLMANHWPSKYGGAGLTNRYRLEAAKTVRNISDSLLIKNPEANIVVFGDLNDEKNSGSVQLLQVNPGSVKGLKALEGLGERAGGTLKYQGRWMIYDQYLVSHALLEKPGLYMEKPYFRIYDPEFLLTKDERYGGIKPFRTWEGYRYAGGFSDHLPVILELRKSDSRGRGE